MPIPYHDPTTTTTIFGRGWAARRWTGAPYTHVPVGAGSNVPQFRERSIHNDRLTVYAQPSAWGKPVSVFDQILLATAAGLRSTTYQSIAQARTAMYGRGGGEWQHSYPPPPLQTPGLARDGLPGGGRRRSPSDGLPGGGGIARVFQGKLWYPPLMQAKRTRVKRLSR